MEYITLAELKEVKALKTLSNDIEIRLVLLSHDTKLLDLGKMPADTLFELKIKPSEEYGA